MPDTTTTAPSGTQAYMAYCGCSVPGGITAACENCQNCSSHCSCDTCGNCRGRFYEEEFCTTCHRCLENGCCQCYECPTCSVRQSTLFCADCTNCETHCRCYLCQTCNVRFRAEEDRAHFHQSCGRCADHCSCYTCRTCASGNSARTYCGTCTNCHTHCNCVACQCGRRVPASQVCSCRSGRCTACCLCRVTGVKFRQGKFKLFTSKFHKGEFKRNPMRRHISVEMEVDRFTMDKFSTEVNMAIEKWGDAVVADGSIPRGFEINTNPTNGDLFLDHVQDLCNGLAKISSSCTTACGLHVHINVKGTPLFNKDGSPMLDKSKNQMFDRRDAFTAYDLRRLAMLYFVVEPALFELCEPRRVTTHYSAPCGDYYMTKGVKAPKKFRQAMVSKMYRGGAAMEQAEARPGIYKAIGSELKRAKSSKYQNVRYKALNLHSFFLRGTVEFRHHEGTVDYNVITNWALTCATVVDQASKMTEAQIRALPKDPREALLAILPNDLKQYAERKWQQHESMIPRYRETVADVWRNRRNLSDF